MGYNYDTIEDLLNEPFELVADSSKDIILKASNLRDNYGYYFQNTPNYFYINGEKIEQLAYSSSAGKILYYIPGMNSFSSKPSDRNVNWLYDYRQAFRLLSLNNEKNCSNVYWLEQTGILSGQYKYNRYRFNCSFYNDPGTGLVPPAGRNDFKLDIIFIEGEYIIIHRIDKNDLYSNGTDAVKNLCCRSNEYYNNGISIYDAGISFSLYDKDIVTLKSNDKGKTWIKYDYLVKPPIQRYMLKNETVKTNVLSMDSSFYTIANDFQVYFNSETQKTELKKCDSEVGDSLYFPIGKGVRYGIKSTKDFDIVISDKSPKEFRPNEIRTPNDECDYVKVPEDATLDEESYTYSFNTQNADKYCLIYFKGETMDSVEIDEIANYVLLSIKDNELVQLPYLTVTAEHFIKDGIGVPFDSDYIISLEKPSILYWQDTRENFPILSAKVNAIPPSQVVISDRISLNSTTIIGIDTVVCGVGTYGLNCAINFEPDPDWNNPEAVKEYNTHWMVCDNVRGWRVEEDYYSGMTVQEIQEIPRSLWDEVYYPCKESAHKYFRIKCALIDESSTVDFVYMRFINDINASIDENQG